MALAAATKHVLIVEPDSPLCGALVKIASSGAQVHACHSFKAARRRIDTTVYDLIVTDVRLAEYNGLHLVYLAKSERPLARAIVFDKHGDTGVAFAVHKAGAFFETSTRLLITLPSYISAPLPPADRRAPAVFDRRALRRGGRRVWDRHMLVADGAAATH